MNGSGKVDKGVADRAEAQRHRILDAAEKCFIRHGFHAASMAGISNEAQVSAGLIYRYFENKDAIILAIIERQLHERREDIASLQTDVDLAGRIGELLATWKKGEGRVMNPALFLEMSAEASRNPEIAKALGRADGRCRADFTQWLQELVRARKIAMDEAEIERRALALQCLVEGLAVRTMREPDLDASTFVEVVKLMLPHVIPLEGD